MRFPIAGAMALALLFAAPLAHAEECNKSPIRIEVLAAILAAKHAPMLPIWGADAAKVFLAIAADGNAFTGETVLAYPGYDGMMLAVVDRGMTCNLFEISDDAWKQLVVDLWGLPI